MSVIVLEISNFDEIRRIFEKFDGNREVWAAAVSCTALLDALLSLASVSSQPGYCWPTVLTRCPNLTGHDRS